MDFRKLSFFESVCRLRSFTKASEELHVTQPSVTVAVQSLEEELEIQLLNRYRGGFSLTQEGEFLFDKAQYILRELEDVTQELHSFSLNKADMLRIGYSVQMGPSLSPILDAFRKKYVSIEVSENESSTPSIIKQLEEGRLDFGIVVATKELSKRMTLHPLFQGEILVCASRKNPISHLSAVSLEEFQQQPLIALSLNEPKNSFIFNVLQESYPEHQLMIKPIYSSLLLSSYFQRIINNDGIGLTYHDRWFNANQNAISLEDRDKYVELPLDPSCLYSVSLIHLKDKVLTKTHKLFLKYLEGSL